MNSNEIFNQLTTLAQEATDDARENGMALSQDYFSALADVAEKFGLNTEQIDELQWFGQEQQAVEDIETEDTPAPVTQSENTAMFAIGGINIYSENEAPTVTVPPTIKTHENVCKKCGCSERDGAMFTTIKNGDTCDDCL